MSATPKKDLIKKLLAGSFIFYIFSGVSSILNYAFYPIIARFVSTSQYGEIQFLVSMFTQLAVGFVVLNILAIIISAEISARNEQRQALRSLTFVSCIIILLVVLAGSGILYANQTSLGLSSGTAILALGASLVVNVPFTVAIGRLQGNDQFMASGIVNVLGALFKLVFSLLFVLIGWGIAGAILGIGVGMVATLFIIEIVSKKDTEPKQMNQQSHLKRLAFIRTQALVAMIAVTVITLLSTADSIVSRMFLTTHAAGQYAAVATLAKVILAATSPLMWLALPPAVARDTRKIFLYGGVAFAMALGTYLAFSLFPQFFLYVLLGIDAGGFAQLLSLSSFSMLVCSLAFIAVTVSVCLGALKNAFLSSLGAALAYFAIFFWLEASVGVLQASLYAQVVGGLCLVSGGLIALRKNRSHQL